MNIRPMEIPEPNIHNRQSPSRNCRYNYRSVLYRFPGIHMPSISIHKQNICVLDVISSDIFGSVRKESIDEQDSHRETLEE